MHISILFQTCEWIVPEAFICVIFMCVCKFFDSCVCMLTAACVYACLFVWYSCVCAGVLLSWCLNCWLPPPSTGISLVYYYVTWLMYMCDMPRLYLSHDLFIVWLLPPSIGPTLVCVTWFIDMPQSYVRHDSLICVKWLIEMCDILTCHIRMCDMTHWYVWHDLLTCRICMCHMTQWHASLICVTWLIDMCDMTHWYVWHDSLISVTWLIDVCDMTHWYVWHDSLICVTWLIDICDMTHCNESSQHYDQSSMYVTRLIWHASFIRVTLLIDMCDCLHRSLESVWYVRHDISTYVTWLIRMHDMTFSHAWRDSFICVANDRLICLHRALEPLTVEISFEKIWSPGDPSFPGNSV